MKKWFLLCAIGLSSIAFALPIQDRTIDPQALLKLTSALGIPKDADIIAETQKKWLRKANQERWEMNELSVEQREFVLQWARENGVFTAWTPLDQTYDKALILGATTSRMQLRLEYLKSLWEQGIRFKEIVWLTGERPLDKRVDEWTDRCSTETEAARIVWEETDLPEEMHALPVIFIAVPMKQEGTVLRRPDTKATILAWRETISVPGTLLFVSDQPFCGYQFAVINTNLPETFAFDVVGAGVDNITHPAAAAITLDSVARWIYEEDRGD
jgi:hypothetical protein